MKTIKREIMKTGIGTCLLLLIINTTIFISGCQKDFSVRPVSIDKAIHSSSAVSVINSDRTESILPVPTEVIKINHTSSRGRTPDYCITVLSDRAAIFEGRRNVLTHGKVKFEISELTLKYIVDLFESNHFFLIKHA